ncbi:zonadhesin isoform X2 [Silurus meridionalis]|nr:zonadhesin isoform X2 [Silurus meridionalis]
MLDNKVVIVACDFNNNKQPFCDFRQDVNDDSDWIRHNGPTPTSGTGPSGDYPDGKGFYIYQEADNVSNGQKTRLLSPVISSTPAQICVQFRYYMYGADDSNTLTVLAKRPGAEEMLWQKTADITTTTPTTTVSTPKPSTPQPSTPKPTTPKPTTAQPSTPKPSTTQPTTPKPTTAQPSTPKPSTPQPTTPKPTTPTLPTTTPAKCPPDAEYIECGPACIPSCKDPSTNCTGSCISGCFCKPGFVFRGKRCVPIETCGCLDENNNYYEPGEIVFGNGCSKLCRCAGNYTLNCVDNSCDPSEECRQVGGVYGCYPKDTSTCIASGDPHYTTFDKKNYNFMGNCTYLINYECLCKDKAR